MLVYNNKTGEFQEEWEVRGTSCAYTDIAKGLNYITKQIMEEGKCRLGALTEYGKGIVIYGSNGYVWSSIPNKLGEKMKDINGSGKTINSISITNSGYYCVVYEQNAWYGVVSEEMKRKLNEFNKNTEEILSISINEKGDFAIVTDKHFIASHTSDYSNMKKAFERYGCIKDVCTTNKGICVVCQNGIYYNRIPENLGEKLRSIGFHPDHVTYTDSGTFLITTESGKYAYRM